jgi:hypothetical protein
MASEIFRERQLGNFKSRSRPIRGSSKWRDRRPGMSGPHCDLIRKLPCCVTLRMPAGEVHHLKQTGAKERGMGLRSTDMWAVPLGHDMHMDLEAQGSRNEVAWFMAHGIDDPNALAMDLWYATGCLDKMTRIVIAHHKGWGK